MAKGFGGLCLPESLVIGKRSMTSVIKTASAEAAAASQVCVHHDRSVLPDLRSLDDVRGLMRDLPSPDERSMAQAIAREPTLTKPEGALGRLEELAAWLSCWQGRHPPRMDRPQACVFAGNHGVAQRGVSAFPSDVTAQMVANFKAGGAAINQLCRVAGAELSVWALDLDRPTRDLTAEAAMDEEECARAIAVGIDAVDPDADVVCLGEMGIGNTTAASALCHALLGLTAEDWTGPGSGICNEALNIKTAAVAAAVRRHGPAATDGLEALRRLGGRELAAIAGAVIGGRLKRVPVMLDGFICTAAAAALRDIAPTVLDHCIVAHVSAEPAHRLLVESLGKRPLFDLGLRLGEGSGAVLAVGILKGAVECHTGMATFAEAGVAGKRVGSADTQ